MGSPVPVDIPTLMKLRVYCRVNNLLLYADGIRTKIVEKDGTLPKADSDVQVWQRSAEEMLGIRDVKGKKETQTLIERRARYQEEISGSRKRSKATARGVGDPVRV